MTIEVVVQRPAEPAQITVTKPSETSPTVPVRAPGGTETVVRRP